MRILGIDPGTHRLGYGVIDKQGSRLVAVTYGCLQTNRLATTAGRLQEIFKEVTNIVTKYSPDQIAIEELYFMQNVTTALRVAEARGVVLLAAVQAGLVIAEYKPNAIKAAVAGYGMASKQQIQKMVQLQLKLTVLPKPDDAADGLAVAMCHALVGRLP